MTPQLAPHRHLPTSNGPITQLPLIHTHQNKIKKQEKRKSEKPENQRSQIKASCGYYHLDLKGMARITTWWYKAASAAPMKGPTQNIH